MCMNVRDGALSRRSSANSMGSSPSTTLNTASTRTRVEPGWNLSLRMLLSIAVPKICVSPAGLGDDMVAVVVVVLHVELLLPRLFVASMKPNLIQYSPIRHSSG